mmetsp:Transcript_31450/g.79957  ORF Transcript_31450/g.79957 Transcript_31450/m.79957 type:complete len:223 (-) Transcript_31450:8994-9662(-)
MLLRLSGADRVAPVCTESSHLSMALVLSTTACSHSAGLSGPSHTSDHFGGTSPAARLTAASRTADVKSSDPRRTLAIALIILWTVLMRWCALSASIATNTSTGRDPALPFLTGLSTDEPFVRVCHRSKRGFICWAIFSLSQPPDATAAVAIVLSCAVMRLLLACCTTRSMLGGSPKSAGTSTSGSLLMRLRNLACSFVEGTTICVFGNGRACRPPVDVCASL